VGSAHPTTTSALGLRRLEKPATVSFPERLQRA
jgi:hypothetical protein